MKRFLLMPLVVALGALVSFYAHSGPNAEGNPTVATIPTPAGGGGALTASDARKMLTQFQRAQNSQIKALEHRNKLELKELMASHSARKSEWEKNERNARRKFFAEHKNGPERRAYIRDFMERRRAFLQILSDERAQRAREQEVRAQSLRQDQVQHLKEFQEALKHGERPATRLWPGSG